MQRISKRTAYENTQFRTKRQMAQSYAHLSEFLTMQKNIEIQIS
jgi:hypothetical protein